MCRTQLRNKRRRTGYSAAGVFLIAAVAATTAFRAAVAAPPAPTGNELAFEQMVKPFFRQNCLSCHNTDTGTAGIRVDQLDSAFDDRQVKIWEAIKGRLERETMPPKGLPQPSPDDRHRMVDWISRNIEIARLRPAPKNGLVRRLTVAQYRNTLRELLALDDDLTSGLPPDAISKDGFVNNQETLQLSPMLLEAYFEIAGEALNRALVDPKSKPSIQDFRVELGASVNPHPFPEKLILGADSMLLENRDVLITQPVPVKPFAFEPHAMKTKYRFIEGYQGNDTVRGWREYDSIYHAVFADMRGSRGYPKGLPYSTVREGLLLRPAIPNDEQFGSDGTYGPKANFKISTRELPDSGRFRVTVLAAKYDDGLLLETGAAPAPAGAGAIVTSDLKSSRTLAIPKAGIYQVDIYPSAPRTDLPAPEPSRLSEALAGYWPLDGDAANSGAPAVRLDGNAHLVDSPFGKAVSLAADSDGVTVPRSASIGVADGDFTVSAWIHPKQLRRAGIVSFRATGEAYGWTFDLDNRGGLRLEAVGPDNQPTPAVSAPRGVIRADAWQHVAAVVHRNRLARGRGETFLYVDGYPVGRGDIDADNFDNPKGELRLGRVNDGAAFRGELDEVRLYRRALGPAEIQALVQPGKQFVQAPPPEKVQDVTLTLGGRQFSGTLQQPAFLAVRLPAGPLQVEAWNTGIADLDRMVVTPVPSDGELARRFLAFEKRSPHLGVHMGFRRDCGSTFAPVGVPQTVAGTNLTRFVFEGAMRNYPNPEVEKDNVNYLAGVREIGVRSEYTDGRDMPRLVVRSVEFEGPFYDSWPPASHRGIFVDYNRKDDQPAYARRIFQNFATRAYRRPASPAEVSALMVVYEKAASSGRGFQDSVKDALQVALTSPQFLFLVENSRTPEPEPLDTYELASKLSYFLWNGPPDRTTLRLAAAGTLRQSLGSEVDRMVADPKFSRFTHEFAAQWLSLEKFSVLEPDRRRYPLLAPDTRTQLREEPIRFVEYLMRRNLPVRNVIQSDFIMANEAVAGYYGLGDKTESGFEFIPVTHGRRELGGVLTEAAIMAGLSDGRESNPVKRGAWLARRIIAEPPPDPPPNVPPLGENTANLTLRQRLEQHRNHPGCLQCHSKIDPWGVAMEEFDAGGRLKQQSVESRSTLPDKTEVAGAIELKRYLAEDRIDQVAFSVLKHLATYGGGRTLTYSELDFLKRDGLRLKADGYRMKDMVRYVVESKMFLEK